MDFYPVIPAGGSGKRLWPLSRRHEPKFLLPGMGEDASLLVQTIRRLTQVAAIGDVYVVTGETHAPRIVEEAPDLDPENVIAEPEAKDSAPAIALAAAIIAKRHPGSVMGSFAADHYISDAKAFADVLRTAIAGAEQGKLMTMGVQPTRPDPGYGYVHFDPDTEDAGVHPVRQFKEKPDVATAKEFLATGEYLWNAGMFVWQPEVFLEDLATRDAALHEGVTTIAAAWDGDDRTAVLHEVWPTLEKVAVENVVMEPAAAEGKVATVRGAFPWTDVGDFNTLGELGVDDGHGNAVSGEGVGEPDEIDAVGALLRMDDTQVVFHDSKNVMVHPTSGKLVVVLGMEDTAIVETDQVLLVCARDRVQEVKKVVEGLPKLDRSDLL